MCVKDAHYPQFYSTSINDIFNRCDNFGVPLDDFRCCGGLFADDIVLCSPSRRKLNNLLKRVNNWAKNNKMEFGINKCATMVIRPDTPENRNKGEPTFYIAGQPIPTTNCYTYLGIPFDKSLSLDPIVKSMNNKVRKALYSVSNFLRNPKIPIPFKKTIINSIVISRISYFAPLLGSNKNRSHQAQKLVNEGLGYITGSHKAKSFTALYNVSKDLNIPPLSAKCALAQARCYNKWKNSNCIISYLVNKIPTHRKYMWTKASRTLADKKLSKLENTKAIKNFYWKDLKKTFI